MMHKIAFITMGLLICATIFSQTLPKLASGTVRRLENFPSKLVAPRNIDVWLPDGYDPKQQYAVLYMHDGQMLYDSTNNWNHKEWGVDETAGRLIAEGKTRPFIVVGIWNNGKFRHSEYFPQQVIDYIPDDQKKDLMHLLEGGPMADHYLQFIVTELKPFIDSAFSTRKDRDNTLIGGSSMGGLISMYAFCEYPNVFGSAACLSTHWTGIFRLDNNPIPDAMIQYLKARLPKPKQGRKIYFDYGTATLDALYKGTQIRADAVLEAKGYRAKNWITREFPGADHSENAWGARLSIPLLFLLGK